MKDICCAKKFVVVAYDIIKTKRRTRVMKLLKGNGNHTQKSVFECLLDDRQIEMLTLKIAEIIEPEEDTVRLYIIPKREEIDITILGTGEVYEEPQLVIL